MFVSTLTAAIEAARPSQTDDIAKSLWKAHGAGLVTDDEAELLAAAIEARRAIGKVPAERPAPRRLGSRPKSEASLQRRRRWVAAGLMPPIVAHEFTQGEGAALAVIALEITKRRVCTLAVGHIAALAGVGLSTVRNALRRAKALGFITVRERRRTRFRNDTNVVAVVSAEWKTWLRIGETRTRRDSLQKRGVHDFESSNRPKFEPFTQSTRKGGVAILTSLGRTAHRHAAHSASVGPRKPGGPAHE